MTAPRGFLRTLMDNLPEDLSDNSLGLTRDEVESLLERVLEKAKEQEKQQLHNIKLDEELFKID